VSVNIRGLDNLLKDLEKRLGKERVQTISDAALIDGAKVFVKELKSQFESFKDTGTSIDEITISKPMYVGGVRTVKVHWKGPEGRYRIIHLNEWGTVKNPNPKGKGAIARALRSAENEYRRVIRQAIERGI
jgi:HK97 gp10 family phage protein